MAQRPKDLNRAEPKAWKKDQQVRREVLGDIEEGERNSADSEPIYRNPNRDQARGDWDRTGRRHDEEENPPS